MVSRKFIIRDPKGLHLRPAGAFCEAALQFASSVQILIRTSTANGKSVLSVLGAKIRCGDEIELICDGKDEALAMEKLIQVLEELQKDKLE